ncbi:MAG: nucleotidyltransferase family protein [Cellulosilyticaceae bacterium]
MKINAIILGAGNSTRFGGKKLLTDFKGKPLIMHIIEEAIQVEFQDIILVTQYEELIDLKINHTIHIVENENVDKGISHSIALGIKAGRACDAYMFLVGDQPFVTWQVMEGLIGCFEKDKQQMLCIGYQGRRGSPTLFDSYYKEELLALVGDTGGKQVMQKYPGQVEVYEVEDIKVLEDIDTREDWGRLVNIL